MTVPRVAYVLLEWPRYSETFILNEMLALYAAAGIPERIFCVRGEIPETRLDVAAPLLARAEVLTGPGADQEFWDRAYQEAELLWTDRFDEQFASTAKRAKARSNRGEDQQRAMEPFLVFCAAVSISIRCRELGITHLHCHYAGLPAEIGLASHRLSGISFSFTGHAKDIFTIVPEKLGRRIAAAAFAIACSEAGRGAMADAALTQDDAGRVHRVYHGIRLADWIYTRGERAKPPRVISVGRLTPKKGFSTLLEALALLRAHGSDIEVEIIGDGRERNSLLESAVRLNVDDRVNFPGRLEQDEIRHRFASAAAFVLPSIILPSKNQDGVANVMLEAMASGVPVIVSDVPGLTEIVEDGASGLIFPSGDAGALAERLNRLLGDDALAARLSAAARERVSSLDCAGAAQRLLELFRAHSC